MNSLTTIIVALNVVSLCFAFFQSVQSLGTNPPVFDAITECVLIKTAWKLVHAHFT